MYYAGTVSNCNMLLLSPCQNTRCKTSGTVEAWNYILKQVDHCEKHIRPDVFLRQHFPIMIARQRKFFDDLQEPSRRRIKVERIDNTDAVNQKVSHFRNQLPINLHVL